MLTILALCLAADTGDMARPLDLYELTVEEARRLVGQRVEVLVESGCPVDLGDGFTDVAAHERADGIERHVRLAGERHDIDSGDTITVTGTLRVIEHAEAMVNGVVVPGWTEIRIEQTKARPEK